MGNCNRSDRVWVSGNCVFLYVFKKDGTDSGDAKPRGMYIKGILTLGMASCINQIAMAIVQIVLNNTLRYYGSLSVYGSDIPLACVGVIAKVNMVFMAICIGLARDASQSGVLIMEQAIM